MVSKSLPSLPSLEETLRRRHSVRDFTDEELTEAEVLALFWAAQGVTHGSGLRTAPSAGALYPLELYVVLPDGCFRYNPNRDEMTEHVKGDLRKALAAEALGQDPVRGAPAVFVFTAVYARTEAKYGDRAARYVHLEVGHAAQNLLLTATALNLGAVPIGAFSDAGVQRVLSLPDKHAPLYLIPVGHPA
jgi:SagB-type dehydrogenase family enzyme